jgi:radical SAM superfamily enzyme YgiQ (UPF0313 family)
MRLLLINPSNSLINMLSARHGRLSRYRVWKPLSLLVLAGMTPPEWEVTILDENLGVPDYESVPKPDLVGLTAFSSQAPRAYQLAKEFRARGIPVVMGGIHATMCTEEALAHVDSVVAGEAESVWAQVLEDAGAGRLAREYKGIHLDLDNVPQARHDLLPDGYHFGSIQTTRGCPFDCSFCSVSTFNGRRFRYRPIEKVIQEFKSIREKRVLVVDDNLVGGSREHFARAKDLFRAMIRERIDKQWMAQVTVNMGDDEELLDLAAKAGCAGLFIGFESPSVEGVLEVNKKFNLKEGRDFRTSMRRIQKRGILVIGSFIMGLDVDEKGIGRQIADAAIQYGLDLINVMFLTPLPGTRLWDEMEAQDRIVANNFPEDWQYYTLTFPVARYKNLSAEDLYRENEICSRRFYSYRRIFGRLAQNVCRMNQPLFTLVGNLSVRRASLRAKPQMKIG